MHSGTLFDMARSASKPSKRIDSLVNTRFALRALIAAVLLERPLARLPERCAFRQPCSGQTPGPGEGSTVFKTVAFGLYKYVPLRGPSICVSEYTQIPSPYGISCRDSRASAGLTQFGGHFSACIVVTGDVLKSTARPRLIRRKRCNRIQFAGMEPA